MVKLTDYRVNNLPHRSAELRAKLNKRSICDRLRYVYGCVRTLLDLNTEACYFVLGVHPLALRATSVGAVYAVSVGLLVAPSRHQA